MIDIGLPRRIMGSMIEREEIELSPEAARALIASARAVRNQNGGWTLVFLVDGSVTIDERRSLPVKGEFRMKARQVGRKPNPAWADGGNLRKRWAKKRDSREG